MKIKILSTGIGSVPFLDCEIACLKILETFPHMPFWPQMVRLSPRERMLNQFLEGLDILKADETGNVKTVGKKERENALAKFYENVMSEDLNYFAVSKENAVGLYKLVELLKKQGFDGDDNFVKGQVVGPFTLGISAKDENGISALNDSELFEAIVVGIEKKILWQIDFLSETKRKVVIFLDEPSLSGYGSAFSTIDADNLVNYLRQIVTNVKDKKDVLLGLHCCGNTDWGLLLKTGIDIISLDSYGFFENFSLYSREIKEFIEKGGMIAWGLVPTSEAIHAMDEELLKNALTKYANYLAKLGFDLKTFAERSIFTPSCGMGSLTDKEADMIFAFMKSLEKLMPR